MVDRSWDGDDPTKPATQYTVHVASNNHKTKKLLILALTIVTLGCNSQTNEGYEIANGEFDNLIKHQQVKSLAHMSQYDLIKIVLKPSALENFRDQIEKLKTEGRIQDKEDFRLYLRIVDIDFTEKRIRKIEKYNGLSPPIPIRRE